MKTRIVKRETPGFDDEFVIQSRDFFIWVDLKLCCTLEEARAWEKYFRKIMGADTKETVVEEKS